MTLMGRKTCVMNSIKEFGQKRVKYVDCFNSGGAKG